MRLGANSVKRNVAKKSSTVENKLNLLRQKNIEQQIKNPCLQQLKRGKNAIPADMSKQYVIG